MPDRASLSVAAVADQVGGPASDTRGDAHEGHGSYCTPSYIEIQRANCWSTTGKPKKAISRYEKSLDTLPAVYQRSCAAA